MTAPVCRRTAFPIATREHEMQILQPISGWHGHILAGRRFLKTAANGLSRPSVFNNELIFQITAMAVERLIVGMSQYHRCMPADHTLTGLVECLSGVCPLDEDLAEAINRIAQVDDICTLSPEHRKAPEDADIRFALDTGRRLECFAARNVPWEADVTLPERPATGPPATLEAQDTQRSSKLKGNEC